MLDGLVLFKELWVVVVIVVVTVMHRGQTSTRSCTR
jgi:hypothetical protein